MVLGIFLLLSIVYAAWGWLRPYDWKSDPAARGKVIGTQVIEDHSHYWVTVRIKMLPGQEHDLRQPVRLHLEGGEMLEPADTTLGGDKDQGITDVWFKFWLESAQISGPLSLQMNEGTLVIKKQPGIPALPEDGRRYYTSSSW